MPERRLARLIISIRITNGSASGSECAADALPVTHNFAYRDGS